MFIVLYILFMLVNIAVYSLYSKFILGQPILFNDLKHYTLVLIISSPIVFNSIHVIGMKL